MIHKYDKAEILIDGQKIAGEAIAALIDSHMSEIKSSPAEYCDECEEWYEPGYHGHFTMRLLKADPAFVEELGFGTELHEGK